MAEAHFYSSNIPALETFERNANIPMNERIDAFIPCIGSRTSLNIMNLDGMLFSN